MNGGGEITGQNRGEVVERRKTDNESKGEKQRVDESRGEQRREKESRRLEKRVAESIRQ